MELHFTGLIIAALTFIIIGLFHPLVIKVEYYWGVKPWWLFLVAGIGFIITALFLRDILLSSIFGVLGASSLWKKGWFPMNPKRTKEYED